MNISGHTRSKMDAFLQQMVTETPEERLLEAVTYNLVDQIQNLERERSIDFNTPLYKQDENAALHIAAMKNNYQSMSVILKAGANPDQPNKFGITPLVIALCHGHTECVRLLYETGSALTDPRLTWVSMDPTANLPIWLTYTADIIKLLILATPDIRHFGQDIQQHLYDCFVKNLQHVDLVRVYCLLGNPIHHEELEVIKTHCADGKTAWNFASAILGPPSMQYCARLAIRQNLTSNTFFSVFRLPLPTKMQRYLLCEED